MGKIKLLILGSNGFIGKNIVEYFSINNDYILLSPNRLDLNLLDTKDVENYLKKNTPDVVIHSAVNISSFEDNTQMYFNVERCSEYYGKLITIGSGAEYDMRSYKPMMGEDYFEQNIPADTYGLSKFVASKDIEYSNKNAVNLRVLGIFGKYEDYTRRFISNNIAKALCGKDITLFQNMKFDFIYVIDFIKILEIFIHNTPKYRNYNICTSKPIELLELAKIIHKIHDNPATNIVAKQDGMKAEYSASNARFIEEFGEFEFTDFNDCVKELYSWYKDSIDLSDYCKQLNESE